MAVSKEAIDRQMLCRLESGDDRPPSGAPGLPDDGGAGVGPVVVSSPRGRTNRPQRRRNTLGRLVMVSGGRPAVLEWKEEKRHVDDYNR